MPALTGEPFRGLTKIVLKDTALGTPRRSYTLSVTDVVPDTATGDQADWTWAPSTPGEVIAVTLRFEWDTIGTPLWAQCDTVNIRAHLPGGAQLSTTWSPFSNGVMGDSGILTRTLWLAADPLSLLTSQERWGALELYLQVIRDDAGVFVVNCDSRGTVSTPPAGTTHDWARGYVRREGLMHIWDMSNIPYTGGSNTPAKWGYRDDMHSQVFMDCQAYQNYTMKLGMRNLADVEERNSSVTQVDEFQERSWTGTATGNGANRINEGIVSAEEAKILQLDLTADNFGGDNKFAFAPTGLHEAPFARQSELVLRAPAAIIVDPREFAVHHFQVDDDVFALAKHVASKKWRTDQSAFLWTRIVNVRGEGIVAAGASLLTTHDPEKPGPTLSQSSLFGTLDGQAGWTLTPLANTESKPTEFWDKLVDLTAPSDIDADTHLVGAADPDYAMSLGVAPHTHPATIIGLPGPAAL